MPTFSRACLKNLLVELTRWSGGEPFLPCASCWGLPGLGFSGRLTARPHPGSRVQSLGQIPEHKRTQGGVPAEPRAWAMLTPDQTGMGNKSELSVFLKRKAAPSFKGII